MGDNASVITEEDIRLIAGSLPGAFEREMLLWMSRRGEALLGGLPGGAQHAGDGGPGGAVLSGAGDGRLQLFGGRGELGVGIDQ